MRNARFTRCLILSSPRRFSPDEVVFVDGGSRDGTLAAITAYAGQIPVRVFTEPGCNISQGRNRAITEATGEIIASTDAGVRLVPNWLEDLTKPLREQPAGKTPYAVVSGFFIADPRTTFETAMGATVLPNIEEINPATFLPSSRSVAFLKEAWLKVGGYPSWLDYSEDLIFDFDLRRAGFQFAWAPQPLHISALDLHCDLSTSSITSIPAATARPICG